VVAVIDEVLPKNSGGRRCVGQRIQFPVRLESTPENAAADSNEIKRGESIEIIGIVPSTKVRLFEKDGRPRFTFRSRAPSIVTRSLRAARVASRENEAATADLLRRPFRTSIRVCPFSS